MAKKKVRKEETITLWHDEDDPGMSVLYGHRTAKDFNAAMKREGWAGDPSTQKELEHVYMMRRGTKYSIVEHTVLHSFPATVRHW